MNNAIPTPPPPVNETVRSYAPGTPERASLQSAIRQMRATTHTVLPVIGGRRVENAAWSYEMPFSDVAAIAGHLAFYPDKVRVEDVH